MLSKPTKLGATSQLPICAVRYCSLEVVHILRTFYSPSVPHPNIFVFQFAGMRNFPDLITHFHGVMAGSHCGFLPTGKMQIIEVTFGEKKK